MTNQHAPRPLRWRGTIGMIVLITALSLLGSLALLGRDVLAGAAGPTALAAPPTREQIVAVARGEIGNSEANGGCQRYGPCRDYAWCAMFVEWVWRTAGLPDEHVPTSWVATELGVWGQQRGLFKARPAGGVGNPLPGDIVVYGAPGSGTGGHVALVASVNGDGTINTIDGNVSDQVLERRVNPVTATSGADSRAISGYVSPVVGSTPPPAPPPPSERLGASGAMAVSWDTGRLDVFGRGGSGQAYGNYYQRGTANWPDWSALPGSTGLRSKPVATSWGEGRLDVFAVGADQLLKHWWFDRSGDNRWRGPETIGTTTITGTPAVVSFDPGRVDVFVRDTNNNLRHNYAQRGVTPWPGWTTIGTGLGGDPAVAQWHVGRWDVFATDTNRKLRHWWFDRLGNSTWHGPEQIGDTTFLGTPAVVSYTLGRLDVFGRDTNNNLRHNYVQSGEIVWPAWETWGNGITSDPVAATWANGRLDVFATDTNQKIRHWWFDRLAGHTERQGPEIIGDTTFTGQPGTLGIVAWLPGRLDLFGIDTNNTMRHTWWQHDAGRTWSTWEHLNGTFQ